MTHAIKDTLKTQTQTWLDESDEHVAFDPEDETCSSAPLIEHATRGMELLDDLAGHHSTVHHVWYSLNDDVEHLNTRDAGEDMDRGDWAELYPEIVQAIRDSVTLIGL